MAKRDYDLHGHEKRSAQARDFGIRQCSINEAEWKKQNPPEKKSQLGPRAIAWNEFKKTGKVDDACLAVEKIFGKNAFSKDTICKWIKEEMEKAESEKDYGAR